MSCLYCLYKHTFDCENSATDTALDLTRFEIKIYFILLMRKNVTELKHNYNWICLKIRNCIIMLSLGFE